MASLPPPLSLLLPRPKSLALSSPDFGKRRVRPSGILAVSEVAPGANLHISEVHALHSCCADWSW